MNKNDLTAKDLRRLHNLAWTNADVEAKSEEEIAEILGSKIAKPGSKRAAAATAAAIGMPGIPEHYTNEGEAKRIEGKPTPSAYIQTDEYNMKLSGGENVNDEVAAPYQEANPDRAYRILTPNTIKHRGTRGWQQVYDAQGKAVYALNPNRPLCWKPKEVRDAKLEGYRQNHEALRKSAKERMIDLSLKAERDTGGAIRMLRDGQVVGGVPIGDASSRGHRVTE